MLAKDQTAGVCTAERYTFTVNHDFGMLWKQHASLTSSEKEVKNGLHIQELLNAILLPATLAIVKVLRLFFFFFWPHCTACRISVPQLGIEPVPPAVETQES